MFKESWPMPSKAAIRKNPGKVRRTLRGRERQGYRRYPPTESSSVWPHISDAPRGPVTAAGCQLNDRARSPGHWATTDPSLDSRSNHSFPCPASGGSGQNTLAFTIKNESCRAAGRPEADRARIYYIFTSKNNDFELSFLKEFCFI